MPRRGSVGRKRPGYHERRVDVRNIRQRFLVICEGSKTEPNYFNGLRSDHRLNAEVKVVGLGLSPVQLTERAIQEAIKGYDQIWCVFDRDSWPAHNFNEAFSYAKRIGVQVAYSNEAFELWYLLHFHYYDTGISRQQYIQKLEILMGHPYAKNSLLIYDELRSRQEDALRNARTLLAQYDPADPANDNPSTTVHLLVEELLRHAR